MKRILIAFSLIFAAFAEPVDYIEGERSTDLLTPEVQQLAANILGSDTAAKLLHAIRLNMAKYDADMRTKAGRASWHGRMIQQVIDTNNLTSVEIYTNAIDGTVWRYQQPFHAASAAENVRTLNSRLKTTYTTNGIPTALAASRTLRAREKSTVSNVTVTVEAGK